MALSYGHGNELSAFIGLEGRKYLDQLSDYQLLNESYASLMQYVQARGEIGVRYFCADVSVF